MSGASASESMCPGVTGLDISCSTFSYISQKFCVDRFGRIGEVALIASHCVPTSAVNSAIHVVASDWKRMHRSFAFCAPDDDEVVDGIATLKHG